MEYAYAPVDRSHYCNQAFCLVARKVLRNPPSGGCNALVAGVNRTYHNSNIMTKQELIKAFYDNHKDMSDYINSLSKEQFVYSRNGKWTAGQQFSHIYLTLLPFPKILPSKEFIEQKFGKIDRPIWDYETVLKNYFKTSLKAPQQYLPEQVNLEQKATITNNLQKILMTIQQLLDHYTDLELDTLVLPHPLLGKMTIREMFYLMTYHATHHQRQTEKTLGQAK